MASSTVRTFTDPDAYRAAIRARRVEGVVTARGNFHAEMTRIDLDRVLMQHAEDCYFDEATAGRDHLRDGSGSARYARERDGADKR